MVRNGPTKRPHGDTSARLGLAACILAPPLLMAAGVAFFGFLPPQGAAQPPAAEQAQAPQSIVAKTVAAKTVAAKPVSLAGRPDVDQTFALADAEIHPVITEKRPEPRAAGTRSAAGGDAAAVMDPAPYYGPVPVVVVRIRKASEQPEMADVEATTPTAAPAKISRRLPIAKRGFATVHARGRIGRHEPRTVHSVKQQHRPSLSRPAPRPSIRRHAQHR
jgi:hypothetical protein